MESQNKLVYIIDHSIKLGHYAIFSILFDKVISIQINGTDGHKVVSKSGQIFFADKESLFFDLNKAVLALQKLSTDLTSYAYLSSREILNADIENKIVEP